MTWIVLGLYFLVVSVAINKGEQFNYLFFVQSPLNQFAVFGRVVGRQRRNIVVLVQFQSDRRLSHHERHGHVISCWRHRWRSVSIIVDVIFRRCIRQQICYIAKIRCSQWFSYKTAHFPDQKTLVGPAFTILLFTPVLGDDPTIRWIRSFVRCPAAIGPAAVAVLLRSARHASVLVPKPSLKYEF